MILLKNPQERSRFLRYSIVGGVGALVDFSVLNLLITVFGVSSVIASIFSFLAAVGSNFTWNRLWTYPDSRTKHVSQQIMEFTAVSIIGLTIRTPVFAILEQIFTRMLQSLSYQLPLSSETLGRNIALASVIGIVMLWNFIVNRFWTFSDID
jgi:putative flippase GtrA